MPVRNVPRSWGSERRRPPRLSPSPRPAPPPTAQAEAPLAPGRTLGKLKTVYRNADGFIERILEETVEIEDPPT